MPMAMSNSSIISSTTNLNLKISKHPSLSPPSNLIKLHPSNSLSSFPLKKPSSKSPTSDWAQPQQEGEPPPENFKIFVGNLPYDVNSQILAQLFQEAGVVEIAEVIYNKDTYQSRGFGFVTMSTVEEAEKAVDMFQRYELNGRILTVNTASARGSRTERPPDVYTRAYVMYVSNLGWSVDNARLEQIFREYGRVIDTRVIYDRQTGRSRGFGFVALSTEAELNDAIANLDGRNIDGREIKVSVAEDRPRRILSGN